MDQTSSILYAANHKQESFALSALYYSLTPQMVMHVWNPKSVIVKTNFINISRIKSTFEY